MISIYKFYIFKPIPTDCTFKHDVNCTHTLLFKIFIVPRKHLVIYGIVVLTTLTITNEGRKYIYPSCNIRDFGQLLNNLPLYLQILAREHEKANKKLNSKSLSVIFNRICLPENLPKHTHTHTHYIYIYIYIYILHMKMLRVFWLFQFSNGQSPDRDQKRVNYFLTEIFSFKYFVYHMVLAVLCQVYFKVLFLR